ncbi:hypothetical protein GCM10011505_46400 [Tistrella bauzanensis]|uniref:DUF1579 domain-containing protein n=1 Tax=Tistrella bauzanensis TaxID=657419 RepID=A0ABQ1J5F3_9PROT|nr:DUF1579 domain-containing protein [Tistrella bauzanensis]GGB60381.1 hypothetical protein GCM10011505_46400 [Tistrella bauzanensis]
MHTEPGTGHLWLQRLIGSWQFTADCSMGPDKPRETFNGSETVRSLGGLWIIGEGQGEMPGGGIGHTILTLGFDPATGRYPGTWIGSMMSHLWLYDGSMDPEGKVLTLASEGPSFAGDGSMARYQDVITLASDDERILTSRVQMPDGGWQEFMTATYRRTA